MRFIFLFVLAHAIFISDTLAQKRIYNFLHFTEKEGLSSNEIAGLAQDSEGLIWISSKHGLSYFDGQKFTDITFDQNPEVLTNYLGNIAIDKKNRIWMVTNSRGLICYDRSKPKDKSLSTYTATVNQNGLVKANLYDVLVSKSGLIYFSGQETDLQCLDPETGKVTQIPMSGLKTSNVLSIYCLQEDSLGNIWMGTRYDGLICYNPQQKTAKQIDLKNKGENGVSGFVFKRDKVYSAYYDYDLIAATYNFKEIDKSILGWKKNNNYYDNFISAMSFWPDENKILIGHVSKGLYMYQPETNQLEYISWKDIMPDMPKETRIYTFKVVKEGYWIATGAGLFFYSSKLNKVQTLIENHQADPIVELFKWNNAIWYRTENNFGEINQDLTVRKSSYSFKGIKSGVLNKTEEALYFSTLDQGVYEFNSSDRILKPLPINGELHNHRKADCNSIVADLVDGRKILWIGSWNSGLYKYDLLSKQIELYTKRDGLPDQKIISIAKDAQDSLWIAMDGYGLVLLENKKAPRFKQFARKNENQDLIQSNTVFAFYLDSNNRFWFSNSSSGIAEIKQTTHGYEFIQYPDKNPHPWLYPVLITEDHNGLFWIKALDGTMLFESKTKSFLHLNKAAGIYPTDKYNTYNYFIDGNRLIWCTDKGLLLGELPKFNAHRVLNIRPTVNRFILQNIDRTDLMYADQINLKPNDNNFSFSFSAVEQLTESGLKFQYKLEGFDKDWVESSVEQMALYNNLEGGKYVLSVRVGDQFNNWSPTIASVKINLDSHWYATIWFKVFLIVLLISTISLFFFYRLNEHKRINKLQAEYNSRLQKDLDAKVQKIHEQALLIENEKQEKLEKDFKQKLFESELKAIRSQMNPHFIFNVLNSIEAYVVENDSKNASNLIQKFSTLSRIVLENSQFSLVSIRSEVQLVKLYLELEKLRFNNAFEFYIEIDPQLQKEEKKIPSMLIQPLVENAVHHGIRHLKKEKGKIKIKLFEKDQQIIIDIFDNGIGFNDHKTKTNSFKTTSFGIKGIQERINIINRNLNIPVARLSFKTLDKSHEFSTHVTIVLPAHETLD